MSAEKNDEPCYFVGDIPLRCLESSESAAPAQKAEAYMAALCLGADEFGLPDEKVQRALNILAFAALAERYGFGPPDSSGREWAMPAARIDAIMGHLFNILNAYYASAYAAKAARTEGGADSQDETRH